MTTRRAEEELRTRKGNQTYLPLSHWPRETREEAISTAERGGAWSFRNGYKSRVNPYINPGLSKAWLRGYHRARKESA